MLLLSALRRKEGTKERHFQTPDENSFEVRPVLARGSRLRSVEALKKTGLRSEERSALQNILNGALFRAYGKIVIYCSKIFC